MAWRGNEARWDGPEVAAVVQGREDEGQSRWWQEKGRRVRRCKTAEVEAIEPSG